MLLLKCPRMALAGAWSWPYLLVYAVGCLKLTERPLAGIWHKNQSLLTKHINLRRYFVFTLIFFSLWLWQLFITYLVKFKSKNHFKTNKYKLKKKRKKALSGNNRSWLLCFYFFQNFYLSGFSWFLQQRNLCYISLTCPQILIPILNWVLPEHVTSIWAGVEDFIKCQWQ